MPTGAAVVKDGDFFTDALTGPLSKDSKLVFITAIRGGGLKFGNARERAQERKNNETKGEQTSASHERDPAHATQQIPDHAVRR